LDHASSMFRGLCCLLLLAHPASSLDATARWCGWSSAAPRTTPLVAHANRFEICQGKYCSKKGAKRTLALFEELGEQLGEEVIIEKADMSHTEHGCFDECTMGPNVRIDGDGPQTDGGRIINGVRGAAAVAELLGVEPLPESA